MGASTDGGLGRGRGSCCSPAGRRARCVLASRAPTRNVKPDTRGPGNQGTRPTLEYHARVVPWHLGILVPVVSSAWTREPRNQAYRVHHVRMVPWSLGILVPAVSFCAASNNQLVHSGFCSPDFTGPAEQLTHPRL